MKISPEKILQELAAIAFARVPECMELVCSDVRLKEKLKPAQRVAIASSRWMANRRVWFLSPMCQMTGSSVGPITAIFPIRNLST